MKQVPFGSIATGFDFKFPGDNRTWFKGQNETAFTFTADGNTRIYTDAPVPFSQPVLPLTVVQDQPHRDAR